MAAGLRRLCALDDLPSPGSAAFQVDPRPGRPGVCVVRLGERVFGYLNSCPHTGAPMDWQPGQFLDMTLNYIQCSLHGAQFRIRDGFCVYGPCAGEFLVPVTLVQRDGQVFLEES